jgi:hypothetical protein
MYARVDPAAREIVAEGRTFRFRLDLRGDTAIVSIDGRERPVRPLSWGEKVRLARFAAQAPELVRAEVLRACADAGDELPQLDRDVLWALSAWLNEPPDAPSIPLDSRSLAIVTLQLCRAMHLRPADFIGMAAADVEAMWLALGSADTDDATPEAAFAKPFPSIGQRAVSQGMETRIVIVPDPEPAAVSPEGADGRRESERSTAREPRNNATSAAQRGETFHRPDVAGDPPSRLDAGAASQGGHRPEVSVVSRDADGPEPGTIARDAALGGEQATISRDHDSAAPSDFTGYELTSRVMSPRRRTPLRFRMQPAVAGTSAAQPWQAMSPSSPAGAATAAAAQEQVVSSFALFEATELPRAGQTDLEPLATDRQSLFDELADRLEQAAADMGIPED